MRLILSMTVGVLALSALSACGQNEESIRASYRTQAMANCRAGATPAAVGQLRQMGVNAEQLCSCAIDRYMRATPLDQLKRESSNEMPPGLTTATTQCVTELMRQAAPAVAPTPNEAAPAAEAPPAEAPPAEEENGAAEENGATEE
jgi:hypothetical protein